MLFFVVTETHNQFYWNSTSEKKFNICSHYYISIPFYTGYMYTCIKQRNNVQIERKSTWKFPLTSLNRKHNILFYTLYLKGVKKYNNVENLLFHCAFVRSCKREKEEWNYCCCLLSVWILIFFRCIINFYFILISFLFTSEKMMEIMMLFVTLGFFAIKNLLLFSWAFSIEIMRFFNRFEGK